MGNRFLLPVLLAAGVLSTGSAALAGPTPAAPPRGAPAPPPKPKDRADDLFDQATAALDAKRFDEAEAKYEEAWELKQTYDIAGNFGVTKRLLGKNREAAHLLTWALEHMPPTEGSSTRKGLEQELQKARAEIGALRVRVNVDAATVTVNGRDAGTTPLADEVFVEPGTVRVQVRRDGYATVEQTLTIAKGDARTVSLALEPERRSIVPTVAVGAGAVVLLAGGIVSTVLANSKASDANIKLAQLQALAGSAPCKSASVAQGCATLHSLNTSSDTFHDLAVAGFIAGGATGAAALTYALWPAKKGEQRSGFRVAPIVGAGVRGLAASGTF